MNADTETDKLVGSATLLAKFGNGPIFLFRRQGFQTFYDTFLRLEAKARVSSERSQVLAAMKMRLATQTGMCTAPPQNSSAYAHKSQWHAAAAHPALAVTIFHCAAHEMDAFITVYMYEYKNNM